MRYAYKSLMILIAFLFLFDIIPQASALTTSYADVPSNYKALSYIGAYNLSYVFVYEKSISTVYFNMTSPLAFEGHNYTNASDVEFVNYSAYEGYWYNTSGGVVAEPSTPYEYNITLILPDAVEANFTFYVILENKTDADNVTTNLYLFVDNLAPRYDLVKNTTYAMHNVSVNLSRTFSINDSFFDYANYSVVWENASQKQVVYARIYEKDNPYVFNYSGYAYVLKDEGFIFMPSVLDNGSNLLVPAELYDSSNTLVKKVYLVYNYSYLQVNDEGKILSSTPASLQYLADLSLSPLSYTLGDYYVKLAILDELGNFIATGYKLDDNASLYMRAAPVSNYTFRYALIDEWNHINASLEFFEVDNSDTKNAPLIVHHFPENKTKVLLDKSVLFEAYVKDYATLNATCSLVVENSFVNKTYNLSDDTFDLSFIFSSSDGYNEGNYSYFWWCENDLGLANMTEMYVVEVLNKSDIELSIKYFTYPYYRGIDFEGNVSVCNIGSRYEVEFNVSIAICKDASCSNKLDEFNYTYDTLNPGVCKNATFNISAMDGEYYIIAKVINATNDFDDTNNYLTRIFSTYPKINVIKITNPQGGTDLTQLKPKDNITYVLNITDHEGAVIEDITYVNLTAYDKWSEKLSKYVAKQAYVLYDSSSKLYYVNYTLPGLINGKYYEYGTHGLILSFDHLTNYTPANVSEISYTLKAPYLVASLELLSSSIEKDDTTTLRVRVKNEGNVDVDFANIEVDIIDETIATFTYNNDDTVWCNKTSIAPSSSYSTICEYTIKGLKEGSTDIRIDIASSHTFYNATGYEDMKLLSESRIELTVTAPTTTTEEESTTSSTSTTSQTQTTSSEDNETSNETATTTAQQSNIKLEINVPQNVEINYPNSTEINVEILNKGDETITLDADSIDVAYDLAALNISYVMNKVSIAAGKKHVLKLSIKPRDVGKYMVSIIVKVENSKFTKDFTVIVYPDESKKQEIMQKYEEVKKRLNELKEAGDDTTQALINSLEAKLENVSYYLEQEKYVEAYSLLKEVEEDINSLASNVKKEESGSNWLWWLLGFLIVGGIAGGAIFYYLWMPEESGFDPSKGYYFVPPVEQEERKNYLQKFADMIKEKLGQKKTIEDVYPDLKNDKEEW